MSSEAESDLLQLLRRIAEEQNYKNCGIKVSPLSTGGANYSSLLYTAEITSPNKVDLHLFIKELAISKAFQEAFTCSITEKEKTFYTIIQQLYKNIEKKHHVPEEHCLKLPRYFGVERSSCKELLVIENIAARGYLSFDRFTSMDWEYASKSVTELAKLHALSVALKMYYPDELKRISQKYFVDEMSREIFDAIWFPAFKHALSVIDGETKAKFQKYFDKRDIFSTFIEYKKSCTFKLVVHGDYRPSNFMHKYLEDNSVEMIILDYQTMSIGSPISDLLTLVAMATDKPFRDQYYDKLIKFYYIQLSEALRRLDIDPEKTYSKDEYYADLKQKLPMGLILSVFGLPIITVEADKAPELKPEMTFDSFAVKELGPLYADRMRDMVNDYIQWGVLTD